MYTGVAQDGSAVKMSNSYQAFDARASAAKMSVVSRRRTQVGRYMFMSKRARLDTILTD